MTFATAWSHPSSLAAYCKSLELLDVLLATGRSLESRHLRLASSALKRTQSLAVNGAAHAIGLGCVELAIEMLEQGRSVLLTQAGKYRTQVDGLEDSLANAFRAVSVKMEASAMNTGLRATDATSHQTSEDAVAA